ncbi:hypothetical protein PENSPDRAFT_755572 [Peniophora sp. CONT]|nr:hypothetical protein PENSPDRAFT_755572 [Peniophora sp. CONT]
MQRLPGNQASDWFVAHLPPQRLRMATSIPTSVLKSPRRVHSLPPVVAFTSSNDSSAGSNFSAMEQPASRVMKRFIASRITASSSLSSEGKTSYSAMGAPTTASAGDDASMRQTRAASPTTSSRLHPESVIELHTRRRRTDSSRYFVKKKSMATPMSQRSTISSIAKQATWVENAKSVQHMWSVYLEHVERVERKVQIWKADAEGLLTFCGLFSAMVAAFLIEGYKSLSLDFNAASALLLLSQSSKSDYSAEITKAAISSLAKVPSQAVIVYNSLWVASLLIALSCALCTVLVQQWARRFERLAERRSENTAPPSERARVHLHLMEALRCEDVAGFIDSIPRYLHFAILIFVGGLLCFLSTINLYVTVSGAVPAGIFVLAWYLYMTFRVWRNPATLFQTPMTNFTWAILNDFSAVIYADHVPSSSFPKRVLVWIRKAADCITLTLFLLLKMVYFPVRVVMASRSTGASHAVLHVREHRGAPLEDAVLQALRDMELSPETASAALIAVFKVLCNPNDGTLDSACVFLTGICTLAKNHPRKTELVTSLGARILEDIQLDEMWKSDAITTSRYDSWPSWIWSTLCHQPPESADKVMSYKFAALCLRLDYLRHDRLGKPYENATACLGLVAPNVNASVILEQLARHPLVGHAALTFRAWVASALDAQWAYEPSDETGDTWPFWRMMVRISEEYESPLQRYPDVPLAELASPNNRAILIIMSLVRDVLESIATYNDLDIVLNCIRAIRPPTNHYARAIGMEFQTFCNTQLVANTGSESQSSVSLEELSELLQEMLVQYPDTESPAPATPSKLTHVSTTLPDYVGLERRSKARVISEAETGKDHQSGLNDGHLAVPARPRYSDSFRSSAHSSLGLYIPDNSDASTLV